ncbi:MAG: hypothetical protein AAF266_00680 [Planctomycetota bacterium]
MTIDDQIADFTAFAKNLAQQQGDGLSLDEVYQRWKGVDPAEATILKDRFAAFQAEGPGQPVDEFLKERRAARDAKRS